MTLLAEEPHGRSETSWRSARTQVDDLLDTGAGIEHRRKQRVVTTTVGVVDRRWPGRLGFRGSRGTRSDARGAALERDGEHALTLLDACGLLGGAEPEERVNRRQSDIPRRDRLRRALSRCWRKSRTCDGLRSSRSS